MLLNLKPTGRLRAIVLFVGFCIMSAAVMAQEVPPQIPQKHMMKKAVQVRITKRGMKYYAQNLGTILGNLQYQVNEGYFPPLTYEAEQAINPDDFAKDKPEVVQIYRQVRDMLNKWFIGFSLVDHRPRLEMGEFGYVAEFNRFALVSDPETMRAIGKQEGAVLAIELSIKSLTAQTELVTLSDTNNPFLGKFGLQGLTLLAGSEQQPLLMRLPFYIRVTANGSIEFQALDLENNLNEIPLSFKYDKLVFPSFSIEIDGKRYPLNTQELDNFLLAEAPALLEQVRGSIADLSKKQIPALLNQKVQELFAGGFEQVDHMPAPGKPDTDTFQDLLRGMRLSNLNGQKDPFVIDLDAYLEDPYRPHSQPIANQGSRGSPRFDQVPLDQFDLAIAIDRSFLNRATQLGFERGYFKNMPQADGSILKLASQPTLDYIKTPKNVTPHPQESYLKMHVAVENEPGSFFLKDRIVVELDVVVKLRPMGDKSLVEMVLVAVDESSISMDDRYLSIAGKLLKGKVHKEVKSRVMEMTKGWSTKEETLSTLPLPPQILGIELVTNRIVMDPNGHLVMYLNYANGVN